LARVFLFSFRFRLSLLIPSKPGRFLVFKMDLQPTTQPASSTSSPPPSVPDPDLGVTWPRSAQFALGVLLAASLLILAGRSLLVSLQAGPSTMPRQRIDINSADAAELMLLPGVGESLAARIAAARAPARFERVDDLRKVPGIGPATLERLRPWVFVTAGLTSTRAEPALPLSVEPSKRPGAKSKKAAELTSPIDVSTADASQLMRLPGIGPVLSQRILDERARKPFQSVADLRRVKGIGPKTLEKIAPFITVPAADSYSAGATGSPEIPVQ
jgi:competence protein ComEA